MHIGCRYDVRRFSEVAQIVLLLVREVDIKSNFISQNGRRYVTGGGILGCWGGRSRLDGLDGVSNPGANMSNQPIELIEASVPMAVTRYESS